MMDFETFLRGGADEPPLVLLGPGGEYEREPSGEGLAVFVVVMAVIGIAAVLW